MVSWSLAAPAIEPRAPITSAQEVRSLLPEEADRGYPVRLQGIVLYFKASSELMIYDGSAALYIAGTSARADEFKEGDRVIVHGVTSGGDFAPMVVASNVTLSGHGTLPLARECTFSELTTGAEDGQWVKVSGIVRMAVMETVQGDRRLTLELAVGTGRLTVRVPGVEPLECSALVDSKATVTGICFPVFNGRRQLLGIRLRAPALSHVQFSPPEHLATFNSSAQPISSLLKFQPGGSHRHRVKVRGVVTFHRPGENLVIRDDTQALWVKSAQPDILEPGDVVEVLGFPVFGDYNPELEDAAFVRRSHGSAPKPLRLTSAAAVAGEHDAELVEMEATLLDSAITGLERILILRAGNHLFRALLPLQQSAAGSPVLAVPPVSPGAAEWISETRLRLTGICQVEPAARSHTQPFQLLLRSAADVQVISTPSWWTLQRVVFFLGVTMLISLGAIGWVLTLRRRVRMQTREIHHKAEREAILEERSRIAREFHDTLEQELSGVLLQLQAARQRVVASPHSAQQVLEIAESMLRHTQSEARNSIWDLRARALENGTLESALRTVANSTRNGAPVEIAVALTGDPRPLSSHMENHLLRISQEATANAIKHAAAAHIRITVQYKEKSVELSIEDDGQGFDVSGNPARPGHFGLLGMRERAEKIGGQLAVRTAPGKGTRIEVLVPLEPMPLRNGCLPDNPGSCPTGSPHEKGPHPDC